MIKLLLLSALLFTNSYQILASDSCDSSPASSKMTVEYLCKTNIIYASLFTGLEGHKERVTTVCKNLTTGEFKASETLECSITGKQLTHFIPDTIIVARLRAKITDFQSSMSKK